MSVRTTLAITATAAVFAAGAALAQQPSPRDAGMHHHGGSGHEAMMRQGMGRGPVGLLTAQDANSAADMGIVMNLVHGNTQIRRTVTRLPDGIRTLTESDDPKIAQDIKAHVASMSGRLKDNREFNIFSTTLPVIFDNAKNIQSTVEYTAKGAVVTRTTRDPKVVAALQAHADEVSELVKDGPAAFHRGINTRMAMGPGGPRGELQRTAAPAKPAVAASQSPHTHDHSFSGAEQWAKVFDDPERDAWQKPHEVIQALKLKPDAVVADIGAGTGYFAVRFAHMLSQGRVYAVDAEPDMVKYLGERARKAGLKNLTAVQAQSGDAKLPGAVDLAVFVDVYHHIDNREAYFRRLAASLKPGGRVAVIDFRLDAPVGPPRAARIAPEQVRAELLKAGYVPAGEHDFLPHQYFLLFRPAP